MRIQAMAAQNRGDELVSWTYEQAQLGPFDCLLRVLACGLCSSDLHMIDNHWGMSGYPLVPGHKVRGEVVEIGPRVNQISVSDCVGVGWQWSACFQCHDCVSGREHCCNKDTWSQTADLVFPPPPASDRRGRPAHLRGNHGLLSPAHRRHDIGSRIPGDRSDRARGLGHLAIQFAAKSGHRVTVFTSSEDKAVAAVQLGVHQTILTRPDGRPASAPDRQLDLLISTVPIQLPWDAYVELVRSGGAVTFVGVPPGSATLPLDAMILQRRRLLTSSIAGRPMIRKTLEVADLMGVRQDAFVKGIFPSPLRARLLKGTVGGLQMSWKGKKLNADTQTGINIFAGETGEEERYPFKIYQAKDCATPPWTSFASIIIYRAIPSGFDGSPMRSSKWRKENTWAKCTSVSCPAIHLPWATFGLNSRTLLRSKQKGGVIIYQVASHA